jgi:hypothetical protein
MDSRLMKRICVVIEVGFGFVKLLMEIEIDDLYEDDGGLRKLLLMMMVIVVSWRWWWRFGYGGFKVVVVVLWWLEVVNEFVMVEDELVRVVEWWRRSGYGG